MKIIGCLLFLAGVASVVLAALLLVMKINVFGFHSAMSYLVMANTLLLLGLAAISMKK